MPRKMPLSDIIFLKIWKTCFFFLYMPYFVCNYEKGVTWSFPGGSDSKESACNAGDQGLILVSKRSPREGNGNPLQYSCL